MKKKVGLMGFGKTGKAVASVILQHQGFSLEWVLRRKPLLNQRSIPEFLGIESDEPGYIYSTDSFDIETLLDKHPVDIIIDFSSESGLYYYAAAAANRGIKIISAVSHYPEQELQYLKSFSDQTVVFWSPNITLGVNYLIFAAKFLKKIAPWVDVEINEEHFKGKAGVSGTALKIADALQLDRAEINTVRAGGIVGKHELIFGFPFQTVRLIHESISREAFGNGAVFIAENLQHLKPGFYNFEDVLQPYFENKGEPSV